MVTTQDHVIPYPKIPANFISIYAFLSFVCVTGNRSYYPGRHMTFSDLVDENFAIVCKEYLAYQFLANNNISRENYVRLALPEKKEDRMLILERTTRRIYDDIRNYLLELCSCYTDDPTGFWEGKTDNLKKRITELVTETEDQKKQITELMKKINAFEKLEDEKENDFKKQRDRQSKLLHDLTKENKKALHDYHKLQREFDELNAKYGSLKGQNLILEDELDSVCDSIEKKDMDIRTIDYTKNYVFAIYDDVPIAGRIKDAFPNATITSKNILLNPLAIDMVICMTKCIDHDVYNGLKTQCKSKGIKFCHCHKTNIEFIKKTMADALA